MCNTKCGQVNRGHKNVETKIIEEKNEKGNSYRFVRKICKDCGTRISDKLLD